MLDIEKETNIEVLRSACGAYDKALRQLTSKVQELTQQLADLQGLEAAQIGLDLPDVEFTPKVPEAKDPASKAPSTQFKASSKTPKKGHGPTPQPDLPVEKVIHGFSENPECTSCGGRMETWLGQYEEASEITVVETTFKIKLNLRQKYRCKCNAGVATAPGPPKLIQGGRYSLDFAVYVAISKFCDHIPLERLSRMAARQGLQVTSQTLWDQTAALAKYLEATWRSLCEEAISSPVLHVDETSWRMMGSRENSKWTLFGLTSPTVAAYHLVGSKSAASAHKILRGFRGTLVVDGFAVYPIVAKLEQGTRIAHCWSHADRKFKDAKDPPDRIAEIRGMIARLYEIERKIATPFPGDGDACARRSELRQQESKAIIREIREWAFAQGGLKRSPFGKAVRYLLKHWDGLTMFLQDPRIPLDNNAAERILRGPVVGRKNFYGNRSRRGAKVAAILYSLIETAKLRGVDPSQYLRAAAVRAIQAPGAVFLPK